MRPSKLGGIVAITLAMLGVGCAATPLDEPIDLGHLESELLLSEPIGGSGTLEIRRFANGDIVTSVMASMDDDAELVEQLANVHVEGPTSEVYAALTGRAEIPAAVLALDTPTPPRHVSAEEDFIYPASELPPGVEAADSEQIEPGMRLDEGGRLPIGGDEDWFQEYFCAAGNNRCCVTGNPAASCLARNFVGASTFAFNADYSRTASYVATARDCGDLGMCTAWTTLETVAVPTRYVRYAYYASSDSRRQVNARVSLPPCDVYPCVSTRRVGLSVDYDFRSPDIRLSNARREDWYVLFDITVTGATSTAQLARCTGVDYGAVWHQPLAIPAPNPYGSTWTVSIPVYHVGDETRVLCTTHATGEPSWLRGDNFVSVWL